MDMQTLQTNRVGKQTLVFQNTPEIKGFAAVAGKKEGDGPLAATFDYISEDTTFGEKTWEKSESRMQKETLNRALDKAGMTPSGVEMIFAGDLLNQCIGSSFGLREYGIPFLGLYGACSTMAESMMLAAMAVDGGYASSACALTSSHFCSAERQYRFPLEYGGQRTPTAQWTVTGAGAVVLGKPGGVASPVRIVRATPGKISDMGIKDANNMGAAMAPSAFETISQFFEDTATSPGDYDMILTGDLAHEGKNILIDLFDREGVDIGPVYDDCGMMIFDKDSQDVHAGGSGCGCSASVLCGHVLTKMTAGEWKKVLFCGTGALLSPVTTQQNESIPGICHLVELQAN